MPQLNIFNTKSRIAKLLFRITLTTFILFYIPYQNTAYAQNLIYSDPLLISTDTTMISTMAASALDKNHKLHIAFVGWYYDPSAPDNVASEIFYTNNITGNFIEPVKLPKAEIPFEPDFENDFYYSKEPTIAIDTNDAIHIAYYRTETQLNGASWICYTNNRSGSFDVPHILYNDPQDYLSRYYSYGNHIMLAAGIDNDSIHIVFEGNIGTGHGGARYSVASDGNFGVPVTIAQMSGYPRITMDNEGIPTILYWINSDTTNIFSNVNLATSKIIDGQFTSPSILFESNSMWPNESAFVFDQYDSIHIVFRNIDGSQMYYIKGIPGQYSTAIQLPTATFVSLMYSIDIGNNQAEYIAYKQAGDHQSLGFMYNNGSGFKDISPIDYNKYGFISAGPQWFALDKETNTSYFVYTTALIYLVTVDLNNLLTAIEDREDENIPTVFYLSQNYPNPFNPTTNIRYSIPNESKVMIKVYDNLGTEIETLVNGVKPAGTFELNWNAANLPSGVYFYRLQAGSFVQTRKMILLR